MFDSEHFRMLFSVTDILFAVACLVITLGLFQRHRKFKNLQYRYLLFWFGLFIFACGFVSVADLINLYDPNPTLLNFGRMLTAFSVVAVACVLFPLRYRVLKQRDLQLETQFNELRRSEERFRLLVETVKDYAIFMLDPKGNIATWNQGAQQFKGYSADEIIGRHFSIFFPKEDIEANKPARELQIAHETGKFEEQGWRIRKDGSKFWANVTITAVKDSAGSLLGFSKVTRDLSERINREEILGRSQRFLDSILENLPNMVFVKDATHLRFVRFNRAGENLIGLRKEELLGKSDHDLFPADQAEAFVAKDRAVLNGKGIVDIPEEVIQTQSGERVLHTRKIPIFDSSGKPEYLLGISEDITEWKIAQEERLKVFGQKISLEERERTAKLTSFLAEATTLLASSLDYHATLTMLAESLVQSMASWVTITLVQADQSISRVAAKHRDASKDQLLNDLMERFPLDMKSSTGIAEVISTGKSRFRPLVQDSDLENRARSDDHLKIMRDLGCVSSIIVPIRIQETVHGAITLISSSADKFFSEQDLAIAEEIGKRAATAIENAKLYEAAQLAVQSRDEFLSIASHELKTPLTALKLQLEFARRQTKPELNQGPSFEKSAKMLDTSTAQVNRLALLVDDLLDVSRIEAGKLNFNFETVDLCQLSREVSERYRDHLISAGSVLTLHIPEETIYVRADRFRLEQVILNVLSNAAKYGAKKPIDVWVEKHGDSVRFICKDHGIGIPEAKLTKIFERFERAIAANNISGLGLGLYIAQEIVSAHDGKIWAESEANVGSTFVIELQIEKEMKS